MSEYKVIYEGGTGFTEEKKSKFIGNIVPVSSEEEALTFIKETRKKYYDARHNCFAYVIGDANEVQKASDDGEPSGTAGRPMLDVLLNENIHNACVVVTRYFGGTLLGTGGLVRNYQGATKEAIAAADVRTMRFAKKVAVTCDYGSIGRIKYVFETEGLLETGSEYGTDVKIETVLLPEKYDGFVAKINETTGGSALIEVLEEGYYPL